MGSWVILELTPKGEKESPQAIQRTITKVLRGAEVYVPAVETLIGEDRSIHYLMHGYAFVRKDRPDGDYFRLEGGKIVQSVLTTPGSTLHNKKVATVDQAYIEEMREQIRAEVNQGIGVGDIVQICSGPYRNIEASVITEIPETKQVQVFVQLRSKEAILTLPRSVLKILDRAPLSKYFAQLGYLRAWSEMMHAVLAYKAPAQDLKAAFQTYQKVFQWSRKWDLTFSYVRAEHGRLDNILKFIRAHESKLNCLLRLSARGQKLFSFLTFDKSSNLLEVIQGKHLTLVWVDEVERRLKAINEEVDEIDRALARGSKKREDSVQNVLIDGYNLAFRCFYAPGMGNLQDSKGRPTGVVLGFLKSLGALRKRYPEAKFWVAWDGSSKRRKSRYGDYKSNRPSRAEGAGSSPVYSQMDTLREILPLLGVRQVWNPDEEADDVIGTLVRGELSQETNIILSTDRDFLQLVTESTMVLIPTVGSRKEILYDVEGVARDFGVPPDQMVELRAFYGDTSDNLPGVPRVPKKVLKALVHAHRSVLGVYSSGLAGVSKGQYERLRSAEPQVRINRELMTLVAVDVQQIDPDVDADGAANKLHSLEIKPAPILETFFGKSVESVEA